MRGKTHPSGMGYSLTIKYPNIRPRVNSSGNLQENGAFSEAQKPGNVREIDPSNLPSLTHECQIWERKDHHGSKQLIAPLCVRDVPRAHQPNPSDSRVEGEPFPQTFLDQNCLVGVNVPGVKDL